MEEYKKMIIDKISDNNNEEKADIDEIIKFALHLIQKNDSNDDDIDKIIISVGEAYVYYYKALDEKCLFCYDEDKIQHFINEIIEKNKLHLLDFNGKANEEFINICIRTGIYRVYIESEICSVILNDSALSENEKLEKVEDSIIEYINNSNEKNKAIKYICVEKYYNSLVDLSKLDDYNIN